MLGATVECHVDDLVIKSRQRITHLEHLKVVFDKLRQHQLKMNSLKWTFKVTSAQFLGFVVCHRGANFDPAKIKAIIELPPPKNIRELRSEDFRVALFISAGSYPTYPKGANCFQTHDKRCAIELNKLSDTTFNSIKSIPDYTSCLS